MNRTRIIIIMVLVHRVTITTIIIISGQPQLLYSIPILPYLGLIQEINKIMANRTKMKILWNWIMILINNVDYIMQFFFIFLQLFIY
ncbi:hypothetical protein RhiirA5_150973 [Rhizophagus irregularis]|uniref:Uncharacterized protein n=1 Tax=Rhizophagus irregularis TaxID=588596 RepID=A0A2N0QBU7_9GLOM|nr:hypothetical protein RhiirA5_150973 [Rhizophagus irregularis]